MKLITTALLGLLISLSSFAADSKNLEITVNENQIEAAANQYYSYDFGQVFINSSSFANFNIRNTGSGVLAIHGIYIGGATFTAWSNCPAYLNPGQACGARVEFRPWYDGYHRGRLEFRFAQDSIFVDLFGRAFTY